MHYYLHADKEGNPEKASPRTGKLRGPSQPALREAFLDSSTGQCVRFLSHTAIKMREIYEISHLFHLASFTSTPRIGNSMMSWL